MRYLRIRRRSIGSTLAAVFLLTAILPGLAAAAQGVQLQAYICSPHGTQAPDKGLPVFAHDEHCQLCPSGLATVPFLAANQDDPFTFFNRRSDSVPAAAEVPHTRRIELSPLNGRAPPLQS